MAQFNSAYFDKCLEQDVYEYCSEPVTQSDDEMHTDVAEPGQTLTLPTIGSVVLKRSDRLGLQP